MQITSPKLWTLLKQPSSCFHNIQQIALEMKINMLELCVCTVQIVVP